MAGGTEIGGYGNRGFTAGEALVVGTAVYLKSDGLVYNADDTAKPPIGWTNEAASASGDEVSVGLVAPTKVVKAGGTVTIGSLQQITTGGLCLDATSDNVWVAGTALEAGSTGSYFELLMNAHVTNDVSALDAD